MRPSKSPGATTSLRKPRSRIQPTSRSAPVSSNSRAAVSPITSGNSSVPALVAASPMPTSGVPNRARSVAMRRSQLAANSSAPPMHTPSIAATTGTGTPSAARVRRWNAATVAAQASRSPSSAANRSSPAEKCSPAPLTTMQRTASSAPTAAIASAMPSMVSRVHALRRARRSQTTRRAWPTAVVETVMPRLSPARGRVLIARPRREQPAIVGDELLVLVPWEGAAHGLHQQRVERGRLDVLDDRGVEVGEVLGAELLVGLDLEVVVGEPAVLGQLLLVAAVGVADRKPRAGVELQAHPPPGDAAPEAPLQQRPDRPREVVVQ